MNSLTKCSSYWDNEGAQQEHYEQLYEKHVPPSGPCATIGGEALRAVSRLVYDCYNNGWCNNTSGAWNFLAKELPRDHPAQNSLNAIRDNVNTGGYSAVLNSDADVLDDLIEAVIDFVDNNPAAQAQGYDMFDLQEEDEWYDDDDDDDDGYW